MTDEARTKLREASVETLMTTAFSLTHSIARSAYEGRNPEVVGQYREQRQAIVDEIKRRCEAIGSADSFEAGDRLRITAQGDAVRFGHGFDIGDIVTVTEVDSTDNSLDVERISDNFGQWVGIEDVEVAP